ncbi:MAG: pentapeptide repeat-containing protein [Planctomycetes bacterium]|nr:pentapeptide repeat-containing protein [Planctomycetota bacterium]
MNYALLVRPRNCAAAGHYCELPMWDTNSKILRNVHPEKLPVQLRERWSLRAATWEEYSEDERRRWREWFDWAVAEGGELWDASIAAARLSGAFLRGVKLTKAKLAGAVLERSNFSAADLTQADLSRTDLTSVWLEHAILNRTKLIESDLSNARLDHADFTNADLTGATIHQTDLTRVDFKDAKLFGTRITEPTWWFALPRITLSGEVIFAHDLPEHPIQDALGLPPVLRRQVADLQYLREMWRRATPIGRVLIWLWGLSCRFGQSLGRWALVSAVVAVVFAVLFMGVPMNMTSHHLDHGQAFAVIGRPDFGRALWFSISTLMTLGIGDEVPIDGLGRFIAGTEVALGYLMLGGLLSIFANKFARLS